MFNVNKTPVADAAAQAGVPASYSGGKLSPSHSLHAGQAFYSVALSNARRIVVKVGTSLIVDSDTGQINYSWLAGLVEDIRRCRDHGQEVLIVSSGAVTIGRHHLHFPNSALRPMQRQAAASAGQVILTQAFHAALQKQELRIAQVLLTSEDTETRCRHLSARSMLHQLLVLGAVPLINENDATASDCGRIGDNDRLAARIAQMLRTDFLILLSDVEGLYTADPRTDVNARLLGEVQEITPAIRAMAGAAGTPFSLGGMVTKVAAAELAMKAGCNTIISNGKALRPLTQLLQGAKATWFKSPLAPQTGRKAWIACSLKTAGAVIVDRGAHKALLNGKSLLPAGIQAVQGSFVRGDIITVCSDGGVEVARGVAAYSSWEAKLIAGHRSHVFEQLLGYKGPAEIIQCDNLVLVSSVIADPGLNCCR
jgi:glutamate 5-kinase